MGTGQNTWHSPRHLRPHGIIGNPTTYSTTLGDLSVQADIKFYSNADHYVIGGTTTGNDLIFKANQADATPLITLAGAGDSTIDTPSGSTTALAFSGSTRYSFLNASMTFYPVPSAGSDAMLLTTAATTTGNVVKIYGQSVTDGNCLVVAGDSDSMTATGAIVNCWSGGSAAISVFKIGVDGDATLNKYELATNGTQTYNSPGAYFTGKYWDGALSQETPLVLYNNVFSTTAPRGRLRVSAGGYTASIMPASTGAVYQGGPSTGNTCIFKANESDTYPFVTLVGASSAYLDLAAGDSFNIRYAGGASTYIWGAQSTTASATMVSGDTYTFNAATQTGGNEFVIQGAAMQGGNLLKIICDSDNLTGKMVNLFSGPASATSVFSVDARGNTILTNWEAATAGPTHQDSPYIDLFGSYWTGAASAPFKMRLQTDVYSSVTPYGQLRILNTPGNEMILRPHAAGADIYGGDATGEGLTLYANSVDSTSGILSLQGTTDSVLTLYAGTTFAFREGATALLNINLSGSTWYSDVATGTAWLDNFQTVNPSTGNIVARHIDASTGITFGVGLGITALKLTARSPNGMGSSWLIDGNNESGQTFFVTHAGYGGFAGNVSFITNGSHYVIGGTTTGNVLGLQANSADTNSVLSIGTTDASLGTAITSMTFSATSGATTIQTGSVAGVSRQIIWDIPIAAGGAADNAIDYWFRIDGENVAGLISETNGSGGFRNSVWKIPYSSDDYGAAWASFNAPTPTNLSNGSECIAYNTNAAQANTRHYIFSNTAWIYPYTATSTSVQLTGRTLGTAGADVTAANDTTLTTGNYFTVIGNTQVNGIAVAGWTAGSVVILKFSSNPVVKHNTAASAGFASLKLAGSADFSATSDAMLTLAYDGSFWRETARTYPS